MDKKKTFLVLIILIALFLVVLIRNSTPLIEYPKPEAEHNGYYPITIHNYNDKKEPYVQEFTHCPQRVAVNETNTLDTLLALGVADKIVAISVEKNSEKWKDLEKRYPNEIKKLHAVTITDPSAEAYLAVQPDFILGWKSTFTSLLKHPTSWWNDRGINTYIVETSNHLLPKSTIEDECKFIGDMGAIFNKREKAQEYIDAIHFELNHVGNIKKRQQVAVIEMNGKAFYNYDNGWIIGDIVNRLGGEMPLKSRMISYETLVDLNPDVIFVVYFNNAQKIQIENLFKSPKFNSLKAVHNHKVIPIAFGYMYTPSVKTIDCIKLVKHGLE